METLTSFKDFICFCLIEHVVQLFCSRSYWNIYEFTILLVHAIDVVIDAARNVLGFFGDSYRNILIVTSAIKLLRVLRLLHLVRFLKVLYPRLVTYCDSKIDVHMAFAYDVGKVTT